MAGDDEERESFSSGRGRGRQNSPRSGLSWLGVGDVEDDDILAMMLGCSTVAEELHGVLSTASPCAVHPPTPVFRGERKGKRRRWRRRRGVGEI